MTHLTQKWRYSNKAKPKGNKGLLTHETELSAHGEQTICSITQIGGAVCVHFPWVIQVEGVALVL